MASEQALRDQNHITVLTAITDDASQEIRMVRVDPTTNRILASITGAGTGDVSGPGSSTDNAVVRWNGTDGTDVQNSIISISDTGVLAPVTTDTGALGSTTLMWSDLFLASGAVINFDNGDVTITHSANTITVAGGDLALGANDLTMTGSIAATGSRVTKGWFTDIESTDMPTVGGSAILTSLTDPQFTTIELGDASDTTLSRVSAGVIAIEGVTIATSSNTLTFTNKTLTSPSIATPTVTTEWDFGAHTAGFTETDNGNSGAADTIDWRISNKQSSTLTDNVTYTFTAPTKPCNLLLKVLTGTGSFTVTWPATVKWSGGVAPTITTTASRADIITLYFDGTNYYGSYVQNFTP